MQSISKGISLRAIQLLSTQKLSGLRTEESILHTQQNIPHQLNVEKGNQL
jgi:hypothetical protein